MIGVYRWTRRSTTGPAIVILFLLMAFSLTAISIAVLPVIPIDLGIASVTPTTFGSLIDDIFWLLLGCGIALSPHWIYSAASNQHPG